MTEELILTEENLNIEDMIYEIRGKQVMLDSDLGRIYKCKNGTKTINQAVKRHINRFPERFMFQLSEEEYQEILKSQFGTLELKQGKYSKYLPYVFTEEGVAMLATVINTSVAEQVSICIMDAFVKMRKFIKSNLLEQQYINELVLEDHTELKEMSKEVKLLQESFEKLEEKELKNKIFFNGEIFDSYLEIIRILNQSKKEIFIIDNYADNTLLEIISKINKNITLITSKKLLKDIDINKYNKQYHNLKVIKNNDYHDRFIILDKDKIYHIGSSINHLGNKIFGINIIEEKSIKQLLISKINKIEKSNN